MNIYPEGTSCEVHKPITPLSNEKSEPVKPPRMTMPELYKKIRDARSKAEAGAAMRQMIPWSDIPPEIWDKLEDWFPTKR